MTGTWVKPLTDRSIRRDLAKLARGINPKDLLDVSTRLGQIAAPVRVLWGDGDPYFRVELGRRLADAFAHATFETVAGGRAFLPLDHPDRVAATILAMP